MYERILVPVDLAQRERLQKALDTAADLARHYGAALCYVGVTTEAPNPVARTPRQFADKLAAFAAERAETYGLKIETAACTCNDPAADLTNRLLRTIEDRRADLVVMASHVPGLPEHLFASNAGSVASHAGVSVFVIR